MQVGVISRASHFIRDNHAYICATHVKKSPNYVFCGPVKLSTPVALPLISQQKNLNTFYNTNA